MTPSSPSDAVPRWLSAWLLAMVALWPLPGIAEAVLTLGALAFALQLGVRRLRGAPPLLGRRLVLLTLVLFLAYWLPQLLSAPDAFDRGRAWGEVGSDLRYLPFLWAVALAVSSDAGRGRVFTGLGLIAAVWTLDALLQALSGTSPLFWLLDAARRASGGAPMCGAAEIAGVDRLSGVLGACNLKLGIVLASLSPFALWLAARRGGPAGWSIAAVAIGVVILLAGARAAWITYALVLACSGWHRLGPRRLALLALVGGLAVAALVAVSPHLQQRVARTADVVSGDAAGVDSALSGRARIWSAAACMTAAHPVNGVGARGFRAAWDDCDPAPEQAPAWGEGTAFHAHQWVLEVLSETGMLGLLTWLAGIAMAWRAWWQAPPERRDAARPAMLALALTLFPLNTHLAVYSTYWGGVVLMLAGLYAGSLLGRPGARG